LFYNNIGIFNQNKYNAKEYLNIRAIIDVATWKTSKIEHNSSYFLGPKIQRAKLTTFILVLMASNFPVLWLYFGNRWRGQGTNLKSCGTEYKKFNIWGIKNNKIVFEKWPI
jgi:hypothetical protein